MNIHRAVIAVLGASLLLVSAWAVAGGIQVMTVEQARDAARSNELILVDIRTPKEWRESGIADVAVPLDMTRKGFVQDLLALRGDDPDRKLALICATGGRSHYLATWLLRNGVTGVVDVPAGMHTRKGWLANQLPVRSP